MMNLKVLSFAIVAFVAKRAFPATISEENVNKVGRDFTQGLKFLTNPLFPLIVVHVRPTPCKTTDDEYGVCKSSKDCEDIGGTSSGECAKGFGVCCVPELRCGSTINTNNSVLINDDYPDATENTGNCQYIIQKVNENICQLRLDFEVLTLTGPNADTSICEDDTFTVVGTAGENPKVICGENSGQHMYVDLASGSGTATVNIATTSTGTSRSWKIRVAQIPCNSVYRAPQNCLQYFTDYSGTINSFNYQIEAGAHHIGGLSYTVCVKSREGYCAIMYQSDTFAVSGDYQADPDEALSGDTDCSNDFVSLFVQDKTGTVATDRYCGTGLADIITYSKPFQIRVITDESEPITDVQNSGFSIRYSQIPC